MDLQSPSKRVALGELSANATSPKKAATQELLQVKGTRPEIVRSGSPLKQVYSSGASSPTSDTQEGRGKKRKAEDVDGENTRNVRIISPVPSRQDDREALVGKTTPAIVILEDFEDAVSPSHDSSEKPATASQESSATKTSTSFSSLINYDPLGSSQEGSSPSECHDCEGALDLTTIKAKTEALRVRLRMAMFKVQTDQTRLPLYALSVPDKAPPPPTDASHRSQRASPVRRVPRTLSAPARHALLSRSVSPERFVRAATIATPSAKSFPQLQTAPILRPTAYSSQHISYDPISNSFPSSPPSRSPVHARAGYTSAVMNADAAVEAQMEKNKDLDFATPIAKRIQKKDSFDDEGTGNGPGEELGWDKLSSSVVKKNVVESLLGLRRGF